MRFALLAGDHVDDFVVIGGLNPDFLAPSAPVPHLGTTDVDLLFELGLSHDRGDQDFGWLDRVLKAGEFRAASDVGWRWDGFLGGKRVRLELLCDVPDSPGLPIELPGSQVAKAKNFGGPAAALREPIERALLVTDEVRRGFPDAPESVLLRFASLGGYIVSKAFAWVSRGFAKDAYDLMFVVMFADGGARGAAAAAASESGLPLGNLNRPQNSEVVRQAMTSFVTNSAATDSVVRLLAQAGDDAYPDQLRNDVMIAASQFLDAYSALVQTQGEQSSERA